MTDNTEKSAVLREALAFFTREKAQQDIDKIRLKKYKTRFAKMQALIIDYKKSYQELSQIVHGLLGERDQWKKELSRIRERVHKLEQKE